MNVKALKLRFLFSFGDVFHLTLAFLLAYKFTFFSLNISDKYLFLLIIVNLSWLLLGFFFGLFDYERATRDGLAAVFLFLTPISIIFSCYQNGL